MNLDELERLAEAAKNENPHSGGSKTYNMLAACTPERILALLRVAEAAQFAFQQWPTIAFEELTALREALRDLEKTP